MPSPPVAFALTPLATLALPSFAAAEAWAAARVGGVAVRLYPPVAPAPAAGRPPPTMMRGCSPQNAALQNSDHLEAVAEAQGAPNARPAVPHEGVVAGRGDDDGELHTRANRHDRPRLARTAAQRDDAALRDDAVWIAGLSSGASQALVTGAPIRPPSTGAIRRCARQRRCPTPRRRADPDHTSSPWGLWAPAPLL